MSTTTDNGDDSIDVACLSIDELAEKYGVSAKDVLGACRGNREISKFNADGTTYYFMNPPLEELLNQLKGGKIEVPAKTQKAKQKKINSPASEMPVQEEKEVPDEDDLDAILREPEEDAEHVPEIAPEIALPEPIRRKKILTTEHLIEKSKSGAGGNAYASMGAAQSVLLLKYQVKISEPDLELLCKGKNLFTYDPQNNPKLLNTTLAIAVEGGYFSKYKISREDEKAIREVENKQVEDFLKSVESCKLPPGTRDWKRAIDYIISKAGPDVIIATVQKSLSEGGIQLKRGEEIIMFEYLERKRKLHYFTKQGIEDVDKREAMIFIKKLFGFKEPSTFFSAYKSRHGKELFQQKERRMPIDEFFEHLIAYDESTMKRVDTRLAETVAMEIKR